MGNQATFKRHVQNAERTGVFTLSKSNVSCFPRNILQLSGVMRSLDLSYNKLKRIPDVIGDLQNLRHLILNNNQLIELPPELGKLIRLESLVLHDNLLEQLPPTLDQLTNLRKFSAARNRLRTFPALSSKAKNLDVVDVSENSIEQLTDDCGPLYVSELNLNRNQLTSLPGKLNEWPRLKLLRVQHNRIPVQGIPTRLLSDSQLHLFDVDGNPLETKEFQQLDGHDRYMERFTAARKKIF
jgi:Leucine-rich repeat (LRR) protein